MTTAEEAQVDDQDCTQCEHKLKNPASPESLDVLKSGMLLRPFSDHFPLGHEHFAVWAAAWVLS